MLDKPTPPPDAEHQAEKALLIDADKLIMALVTCAEHSVVWKRRAERLVMNALSIAHAQGVVVGREAMRNSLEKYGRHNITCSWRKWFEGDDSVSSQDCTCGFTDAIRAIPGGRK